MNFEKNCIHLITGCKKTRNPNLIQNEYLGFNASLYLLHLTQNYKYYIK